MPLALNPAQEAAVRHCLPRIRREISQSAGKLVRIDPRLPEVIRQPHLDPHAITHDLTQPTGYT